MEILKQLLEDMFKTRKLDSFTHHEGTKGIISIRFEGMLRSHIDLQSVSSDQNIPSDNHVSFKRKTKAQTKRDLDRSKGLIKRYNTRAQNKSVENPRHSNQFGNILYSNLSPEADIFVPMFDPSDIIRCSSPVIDSHQNNQEETDGASSVCEEVSSVLPECPNISATSIDVPVMPSEPTEKQLAPEMPTADLSAADICTESLSYLRLIGKARPIQSRRPHNRGSRKRELSPQPTLKCHLCKKQIDITTTGCSYYDKYRFDDVLYFCSNKCMDCYRDSDLLIDET